MDRPQTQFTVLVEASDSHAASKRVLHVTRLHPELRYLFYVAGSPIRLRPNQWSAVVAGPRGRADEMIKHFIEHGIFCPGKQPAQKARIDQPLPPPNPGGRYRTIHLVTELDEDPTGETALIKRQRRLKDLDMAIEQAAGLLEMLQEQKRGLL